MAIAFQVSTQNFKIFVFIDFLNPGPGLGRDLHPGAAWLKCGEKGCQSINFGFHACCHGVKIGKKDVKLFCDKFIRCIAHVNKPELDLSKLTKDLEASDEHISEDSDADFEPVIKKRRKITNNVMKPKLLAKSVKTPGTYKLIDDTNEQSAEDDGRTDADLVDYHKIDSIEQLKDLQVTETEDSILINYNDQNKEFGNSVASRLASGRATVGELDGEKVIFNISPVSKVSLVFPGNEMQKTGSLPKLKPCGSRGSNPKQTQTTKDKDLSKKESSIQKGTKVQNLKVAAHGSQDSNIPKPKAQTLKRSAQNLSTLKPKTFKAPLNKPNPNGQDLKPIKSNGKQATDSKVKTIQATVPKVKTIQATVPEVKTIQATVPEVKTVQTTFPVSAKTIPASGSTEQSSPTTVSDINTVTSATHKLKKKKNDGGYLEEMENIF